jgi:hypothetical protein
VKKRPNAHKNAEIKLPKGKQSETVNLESSDEKISLVEVSQKLEIILSRIDQLTEVMLENRRLIETLQVILMPIQPVEMKALEAKTKKYEKPSDRHIRRNEQSTRNPPQYDGYGLPSFPPEKLFDERQEEVRLNKALKAYEEQNPW